MTKKQPAASQKRPATAQGRGTSKRPAAAEGRRTSGPVGVGKEATLQGLPKWVTQLRYKAARTAPPPHDSAPEPVWKWRCRIAAEAPTEGVTSVGDCMTLPGKSQEVLHALQHAEGCPVELAEVQRGWRQLRVVFEVMMPTHHGSTATYFVTGRVKWTRVEVRDARSPGGLGLGRCGALNRHAPEEESSPAAAGGAPSTPASASSVQTAT